MPKLAPGIASLALITILAACQTAADPPSGDPTPTTPPAGDAGEPGTPASPAPQDGTSPEVVVHEVPMRARALADGVDVRTLPKVDAPILEGDRYSDMAKVPVQLSTGDIVVSTLGPVVVDGESWYQVRAIDGGEMYFEFGWVPGQFLAREGDLETTDPVVVTLNGQGNGGSVSADVIVGTPVTVDFATAPMPEAESCDIDVTLLRTDGLGVNVATETSLTDALVFQLTPEQLSSLFQEEAGTVTLQVETDCSFAASMTMPPA